MLTILRCLDLTVLYMEYQGVLLHVRQDVVYVFSICVGDENLSKVVFRDKLNDLTDSFGIKFVKNIVKK